jgi:hypothetical protein
MTLYIQLIKNIKKIIYNLIKPVKIIVEEKNDDDLMV